jgi:hypothetical protein
MGVGQESGGRGGRVNRSVWVRLGVGYDRYRIYLDNEDTFIGLKL